MKLIDTHCHLYTEEFKVDQDLVIERAIRAGVDTMFLPGIDSSEIDSMLALEAKYPNHCKAMMGLHPCSVKENYQQELQIVKNWLAKRKFAAVGEIGLDFYWDTQFKEQQYEAFTLQMEWALEYHLPIVIHTRNAMQETIELVKPYAAKGLRGIFHCFSGSSESAVQITKMGFLLGIGGVLTYKNAGLPQALENIGVEQMVLETDSPYLTPVPFRGKRNESSYIVYVAQLLAQVKGMPLEELARITTANAEQLFAQ